MEIKTLNVGVFVSDSENVNFEGILTLNVNINLCVGFCTKMPTISGIEPT